MELLKIFNKEEIPEESIGNFQKESSVRIIVKDKDGKVAILYSQKGDFYVLPGGRIEKEETSEEAVIREAREETGCKVETIKEVGRTIEVRAKKEEVKESFCYLVEVVGEKGNPSFRGEELNDEFEINWFVPEKARELVRSNKMSDNLYYNYITERDLLFLEKGF